MIGAAPYAVSGVSDAWAVAVVETSHVGMPTTAAKLLRCGALMSTVTLTPAVGGQADGDIHAAGAVDEAVLAGHESRPRDRAGGVVVDEVVVRARERGEVRGALLGPAHREGRAAVQDEAHHRDQGEDQDEGEDHDHLAAIVPFPSHVALVVPFSGEVVCAHDASGSVHWISTELVDCMFQVPTSPSSGVTGV